MHIVRSDIGTQRFGYQPPRLSHNLMTVSYDGVGFTTVHVDVRTLYKNGNNMGVNYAIEGANGATTVQGSLKPLPAVYSIAEVSNWAWRNLVTLDPSNIDFYTDSPEMCATLQITFVEGAAQTIYISRG